MWTILQVAAMPFPSPQGSQVYVRGMSRALARRGHRVILACYGHGAGPEDPELELLRAPRWPGYTRLRAGPDPVKPWLDLALAAQVAGLRAPVDLVHAHNYEAPVVAWPRRWLRGTPVLYNNHTTLAEELPQYFEGRAARGLARRLGAVADQQVPRRCDGALAISAQAVPVLQGLGCTAVEHVPPGVDPAELVGADPDRARARHGLGAGPWVVYAGNPDRYQDLDVLVDALLWLHRRGPGAPGLLFVSAAPAPELEARAAPLPGGRRRFVCTSAWAEVRDLIAVGEVAALPRATCSGYPIKLLNYLGLGVPVVGVRGVVPELPGVLTVAPRDAQALAQGLAALLARPDRRALGERARAHVHAACTWDARAAELEGVYTRLLARTSRRGAR